MQTSTGHLTAGILANGPALHCALHHARVAASSLPAARSCASLASLAAGAALRPAPDACLRPPSRAGSAARVPPAATTMPRLAAPASGSSSRKSAATLAHVAAAPCSCRRPAAAACSWCKRSSNPSAAARSTTPAGRCCIAARPAAAVPPAASPAPAAAAVGSWVSVSSGTMACSCRRSWAGLSARKSVEGRAVTASARVARKEAQVVQGQDAGQEHQQNANASD